MKANNPTLEEIEGKILSSVEFVRDYLQLRFDGPTLTVFSLPSIRKSHEVVDSKDFRFRNCLCDLIGRIVLSATVRQGDGIDIQFNNATVIHISLLENDYRGPEAVTFRGSSLWVL